jgi:hypothetical protein
VCAAWSAHLILLDLITPPQSEAPAHVTFRILSHCLHSQCSELTLLVLTPPRNASCLLRHWCLRSLLCSLKLESFPITTLLVVFQSSDRRRGWKDLWWINRGVTPPCILGRLNHLLVQPEHSSAAISATTTAGVGSGPEHDCGEGQRVYILVPKNRAIRTQEGVKVQFQSSASPPAALCLQGPTAREPQPVCRHRSGDVFERCHPESKLRHAAQNPSF